MGKPTLVSTRRKRSRRLVAQFAHDLILEDPRDVSAVWERLRLASYYWGRMGLTQSVIGGIEMALWDLKGKLLRAAGL